MKCEECNEEIAHGSDIQRLPPIEKALIGHKSGVMGVYPHPQCQNDGETIVHAYYCAARFFDLEHNPRSYDKVVDDIRESVTEEIRQEMLEEAREEFKDKFQEVMKMTKARNYEFCQVCWDKVEAEELEISFPEEEPGEPNCLWCKSNLYVWSKTTIQGVKYFCGGCQKYWDDEEYEIEYGEVMQAAELTRQAVAA